ncbi:MAG: hypothetical protein V2A79_11090 [Planctomycetota bacterium]
MNNKPFLAGIVVALAVVVCGGVFVLAPRLQSPQAKVFAKTSEHTERARRLLYQFSENQARIAVLSEALKETGVGTDINVEKLLGEEENRTAVEEENARLQELTRQAAGEQRALDEQFLKAAYGPQWQQHQEARRPSLGSNVTQQTRTLSEGLRERDRLLAENQKLLDAALSAVNQALSESVGAASGREDVQANRLRAIILYHLAQSAHHEAGFLCDEAARHRSKLAALGLRALGRVKEKNLVASSGIDAHIAAAERAVAEAETLLAQLKASAGAAQTAVDQMKSRIAAAQAVADEARTAMERLQTEGVDLTDPEGFKKFAAQFNERARTYRQALSEVHRLESGTLLNAQIDSSGDFIAGQYVPSQEGKPVQLDRGLVGLESDSAEVQLKVAATEQAAASARHLREAQVARRAEYQERSTQAATRLGELAKDASKAYTEFSRLTQEAEAAQDAAVEHYHQSAMAFADAARFAAQLARDADTAVARLSPEARNRSPDQRVAEDAWLEQQYQTNAADAQIALGGLYYSVSEEAKRTAEVLAPLPADLALANADPAAWREKEQAARKAGIDVLHTAYDSLQRTRGQLAGHWTIAAEAAAAADLLALLGEEELRNVAISTYDAVVTGQENQPHLQAYVDRLKALQNQ